ncbi:MAG TPA: hypothetical protein VKA63_05705 [Candidatus Krumholzibacteria bacterium]|nr:hypothetical protein [Candidatus Krumholzibacteria bacterium]
MRIRSWGVLVLALALSAAAGCSHHEEPTAPAPQFDPGADGVRDGVTLWRTRIDCPSGADCTGFVQVLFDGEIRVNPLGAPAVLTGIDTLDSTQLQQVRSLTLDSSMIEIFKQAEAGCTSASDTVEVLSLRNENDDFSVKITGCMSGAATDLRQLLLELANEYFPRP